MKKTLLRIACTAIALAALTIASEASPDNETKRATANARPAFTPPGNGKTQSVVAPLSFIENVGQVTDPNGNQRPDIQYQLKATRGLSIFIGNGAIHYQFSKPINGARLASKEEMMMPGYKPAPISYDLDRMDVELAGANKNAKVVAEQLQDYNENYFSSITSRNGTTAHAYTRITYKDIYPGIDWVLYIKGDKLEHEFMIHPGGNVSDIQLKYGGATDLKINSNGSLLATTLQGSITEDAPYAYQKNGARVACNFKLHDGILSYKTAVHKGELVIDPTLSWGTYFNGTTGFCGVYGTYEEGIATDVFGNVYMTGFTDNTSGIATSGPYVTTMVGCIGAYLAEFNSAGAIRWSTYYGGYTLTPTMGSNYSYAVATDVFGGVYITGVTDCNNGIATGGVYQTALFGANCAFLAKFSNTGILQWSTYYGGPGSTGTFPTIGQGLATDDSGNVYMTGQTACSSGIATSGAYQTSRSGGVPAAFLAKFNTSGSIQWATYYGGSGATNGVGAATDGAGNVYITGTTNCTSGISLGTVYQNSLAGSNNAFLAQFSRGGVLQWATYYGRGITTGKGVATDGLGNVYITGTTNSTTGIATSGAYRTALTGSADAFLAKFSSAGAIQWATYYGGNGVDSGASVATDGSGNVYITGGTNSTTGISTSGAVQSAWVGPADDAFLAQFSSAGTIEWATYYGYGQTDAHSVACSGPGNVYIAGRALTSFGIATTGAYQTSYVTGYTPAFLADFAFPVPVFNGGGTQHLSICQNSGSRSINALLTITVAGTGITETYSVTALPSHGVITTGSTVTSGTSVSPTGWAYTPTAGYAGRDTFTVQVSDGTYTASTVINVTVNPIPATSGGSNVAICAATSTTLTATGGTTYTWSPGTGLSATTGTSVIANPASTTIYTITGTSAGCSKTATVSVTVNPLPVAGTITGTAVVCVNATTPLTDTSPGGVWSSGNTGIATVNTTGVVTGVSQGTTSITYAVTNSCGTATTTVTGTVNPLPDAGTISGTGVLLCATSSIPLSDNIGGGTWSSGSTSIATVSSTGVVGGVSSGTVLISYSVTNSCGTAVTSASIIVNPLPSAGTISGASSVCATNTITLSDNISGGTWGSSNTSAATIDNSGIVHAIMAGSTVVSYSVTNVCGTAVANKTITVNPLPVGGNISGTTSVCAGANTQLSDDSGGGTWSSAATGIATVSSAGLVHGVAAGPATISYSVTNSCGTDVSTAVVTVNPLPVAGSITGAATVCVNSTTALTDAATGGVWSSSNTGIATVSNAGVVKGLVAGAPVISYSVTNGCGTDVATKNMTVNPLPDAGSITGTTTVCEASNVTLSDNIPGGTWSSGTTGVATISGSGIVHGVAPGSSVILYTYTNSCGTASVNTTVTVNPLPVAGTITGTGTVCVNATTALTDAATGGVWSSTATFVASANASGLVTGVSAGTTTISYTVTNSCGTEAATAIVTVNALPFAGSITGANAVCEGVSVSVSDAATGGAWSSSNTTVATINSFATVRGRTAGITTISYSVTNGCGTDIAFKTFTVNPQPVAGTISGNNTLCITASTVLSDEISGGIWSSGNTGIASVDNSGIVTGISGGSTTISYSVTNGCGTLSAIYSVTVNPLPVVANITGINTLCPATTTSLSDVTTGGIWSSSTTAIATVNTSGIVTGVIPGGAIISYAVTNSCGTTVVTRSVTVNSMPDAGSITGATSVCELATIPLGETVSAGAWSSSNIGIATVDGVGIVTGVAAGNVNITYSVTNSCGVAETSTTITVLPLPVSGTISGAGAVCAGSSITFSDAVTGGTWSSSNTIIATVDNSGNLTGIVAGGVTISYTITNSCGAVSDTATVAINPIPDAGTISGTATVCTGAATQLSDASNGGTWSSNATAIASISTTGVVNGITAGDAVISYEVNNSCGNAVITTTVTVNPLPVAGTITGTDSVCEAANVSLSDDISGGVWSASNTAIATVNLSGIVAGISAGATAISYTTTNSCGVATATITVRVNPLPFAGTITGNSSVCIGSITLLSDVVSGGVWSSDNASIASVSNGSVSGLLAGTVNISYGITNSCGSSAAVTTATVNPLPDAGAISGSSKVCIGSAITLSNVVSGGAWSVINTSVATINTSGKLIGLLAGTDSVKYTVISSNSCVASVYEVITVHELPDPGVISGTATVCKEGIITLAETISGGTWSTSNNVLATISNTGIVNAMSSGTVTITYITPPDANGCVNDATYTLTILSAPVFTITGNIADAKCYGASGGNITLVAGGGSGAYTYVWTNSDTTAAINDLTAGSYTVQVKDVTTQCILSDTFIITQPDSISVTATITTDRCQASNGVIALEVAGGVTPYSYQWSVSNIQGNIAQGLAAGSYSVAITDMQGCSRNMQLQVDKGTCNDIKVYQGISPNGDGVNDLWIISGIENYPNNTVQLFDRWGDLVYEKSGYNNDWYGQKSNGSLLPAGTYYYLVKLNGKNMAGGDDTMTGSIMLKR